MVPWWGVVWCGIIDGVRGVGRMGLVERELLG